MRINQTLEEEIGTEGRLSMGNLKIEDIEDGGSTPKANIKSKLTINKLIGENIGQTIV